MLAELFDGAGPLAVGLGRNRVAEAVFTALTEGDENQRAAAEASVARSRTLSEARAGVVGFHSRIAAGELTEATFLRGRALAERLGYPVDALDQIDDRRVERFIGLANPFVFGRPEVGDRVVDIGSGAGFDAAIAALDTGPEGAVFGFDATAAMAHAATRLAASASNAPAFGVAFSEMLPVRDASVDLVTSNGVFNLGSRRTALAEAHRILRPGGRLQFGDLVYDTPPGRSLVAEFRSLTINRLTRSRWAELLEEAGFEKVEFGPVCIPQRAEPDSPMRGQAMLAIKPA